MSFLQTRATRACHHLKRQLEDRGLSPMFCQAHLQAAMPTTQDGMEEASPGWL